MAFLYNWISTTRIILVHREVLFGLDDGEDASERWHSFGSSSGANKKLGAPVD
jgi:hypothetical protein